MTQEQHPITPSIELIYQWVKEVCPEPEKGVHLIEEHVAAQAARWGADQELEACCEWFSEDPPAVVQGLRAARRPNWPSLKEQALAALEKQFTKEFMESNERDIIRRAIESIPDEQ